jgi:CRISPR/Cas system endoribonuclease Cas6 (RAMP superfamily)
LVLDLAPVEAGVKRVRLRFLTPTEIKVAGEIVNEPGFAAFFARLRDRIGNLRTLYGDGPLPVDFRAQNARAASVRLASCQLEQERYDRFSTRTRQQHPLGGFTGVAEYEGETLGEFLPYLVAGQYTGVGRQTVWGKGAYRVEVTG